MEKDKNELFTEDQRTIIKYMIKEYVLEREIEQANRDFKKWREDLEEREFQAYPPGYKFRYQWGNESGIS